ncbi:MAG: xanthine dehydrogenase small subunit [Cocleimonas sp.]
MIEFILNHSLINLDDFQADTTLLDYLRLDRGLVGSKEGCASGDCGACTVVIASIADDKKSLEYKSLNSCICLLGTLHGKQVITVEGLKNNQETLHPVQQAMVDKHGSQCGFCTPGFVMSLFAMSKDYQKKDRNEIVKNIDGNLCRCTGYRPIIDAAQAVLDVPYSDSFDEQSDETIRRLKSIETSDSTSFYIPELISSFSKYYLQQPQARLVAGGTDLVLDVTQGLKSLDKVIYIANVKELKAIDLNEDELIIGAAATYEECADVLIKQYPALETHLDRLGSVQIRNVGTIGGNIANASPIGDMPPVLMALDAQLSLQKGDVVRQVSIDDFYTGYKQTVLQQAEFIRDIRLPKSQPNHFLHVYKISKRYADDISAICVAFNIQLTEEKKIVSCRIAMGGMAATVLRAQNCEKILLNQPLNSITLANAQAEILTDYEPLDDVRASREYRLLMAQNLLHRLFIDLGADINE